MLPRSPTDYGGPHGSSSRGSSRLNFVMRGEYCLVKKNRSNGLPAWTVGRATGNAMFETSGDTIRVKFPVARLDTRSGEGKSSYLAFDRGEICLLPRFDPLCDMPLSLGKEPAVGDFVWAVMPPKRDNGVRTMPETHVPAMYITTFDGEHHVRILAGEYHPFVIPVDDIKVYFFNA